VLRRVAIVILSIFTYSFGAAQNITPKGYFLKDSVQIGEPLPYVLSIKYPKELEIVFPDSLHNFFPFELTSKAYFTTKSDSVFSIDSAIYYLTTFEIDTVQFLKMPVYQINEFDSSIRWTSVDSIILNQVVEAIPDSVSMLVNTEYVEVPMAFNYPYASIAIIITAVIGLVIWLIFGKAIRNKIKLYHLKKRNGKFIVAFDQMIKSNYLDCEPILIQWKSYLEKLKDEPYTKLTTREIVEMSQKSNIEEALVAIDKNIYGPKDKSLLKDAYQSIRDIAVEEYKETVREITNG
jgi:hypothetical protein